MTLLLLLREALNKFLLHREVGQSEYKDKTGKVSSVPEYTHAFFADSELSVKIVNSLTWI
jgi:hypothetical protein